MKNQLNDFRRQIDEVDNLIIDLLAKRMDLVKKIGVFKKKSNLPPLDLIRWRNVLNLRVKKGQLLGLDKKLIKKIYETIHQFAIKIEKSL